MEQKKPTKAQLERRINNATLHLDTTKSTRTCFFSDKGLRLTADDDYAIIGFGYSQVVFNNHISTGLSRPWLYTKRIIDLVSENLDAVKTDEGIFWQRLLDVLKAKEDKTEYNIAVYYDWYIFNLYSPLFGIAEDELSSFLVYEDYVHNIARNQVLLSENISENKTNVSNKDFIKHIIDNIQTFTDNLEEQVVLQKKSDEEVLRENINSASEDEIEQVLSDSISQE